MRTVGNVLVGAGAIVGVATITAIATGYEVRLTPEMIQLLTYKALGAASIGLMIVGTWIGRRAKPEDNEPGLGRDDEAKSLAEPRVSGVVTPKADTPRSDPVAETVASREGTGD